MRCQARSGPQALNLTRELDHQQLKGELAKKKCKIHISAISDVFLQCVYNDDESEFNSVVIGQNHIHN